MGYGQFIFDMYMKVLIAIGPLKFYFASNFAIPAEREGIRFGLNFFRAFLASRQERHWG
jgi:hypothetical protein